MAKFIHVVGKSNTGKTTAICAVALDLQARPHTQLLAKRPRLWVETTKVIQITSGGQIYLVGLGSAGDDDRQLKKIFDFLRDFEQQHGKTLDFIVCASHRKGTSSNEFVLRQMTNFDVREEIQSKKVIEPDIPAEGARLKKSILDQLP